MRLIVISLLPFSEKSDQINVAHEERLKNKREEKFRQFKSREQNHCQLKKYCISSQ